MLTEFKTTLSLQQTLNVHLIYVKPMQYLNMLSF